MCFCDFELMVYEYADVFFLHLTRTFILVQKIATYLNNLKVNNQKKSLFDFIILRAEIAQT